MTEHKLSLPIRVYYTSHKKFSLNLNGYRNAHHQVLSKAKKAFAAEVFHLVMTLPFMDKVTIRYKLYMPTRRRVDISNVCSIVDKFFCDALVRGGKLPDDDYRHIPEVLYEWGGVDKLNPRVNVKITTVE